MASACTRLCALLAMRTGTISAAPGLPGSSPRFERPGHVVLGGSSSILPFYNVVSLDFMVPPVGLPSSDVSSWGYRVAQSFVLAVEEINRGTHLPPTLTLGFSTRNSGDSVHGALHETMAFLTGQEDPVSNYVCHLSPPRAALAGDTCSALSVDMARLLEPYRFPQVSYASTLPSLSDKTQFPSFLHTRTSDLTSSYTMTQLLHLEWSWVGILVQDDDFGQVHLVLSHTVATYMDPGVLRLPDPRGYVPEEVLESHLWVQVATCQCAQGDASLDLHNCPERKSHTCSLLRTLPQNPEVGGPLDIGKQATGLRKAAQVSDNEHGWLWGRAERAEIHKDVTSACGEVDDGWGMSRGPRLDLKEDGSEIQPAQEAAAMGAERKVRFQTSDGTHILFDASGDLVTTFDILQGQQSPKSQFHFVHIGTMDSHPSSGDRMMILLKDDVQGQAHGDLRGHNSSPTPVPGSAGKAEQASPIVTESRNRPERRQGTGGTPEAVNQDPARSPNRESPTAAFSASTAQRDSLQTRDVKSRLQCPAEQSPSRAGDRCVPRTEPFPASDEPLGLALTLAALAPASLAGLVFGSLLRFRHTAVATANRALSDMFLASLALCTCPLLFLGRPSPTTRLLRQTTFAVLFTVAVSCVLAKTLTVVLAFRVTRPGQGTHTPKAQCLLVFSLMQVILCGVWLGTSPPFPQKDATSEPGRLVLQCQEGSGVAFSCMLGYLGLLAIGPSSVAFLARGLPDAFSETKFLAFSLLLLRSVWTAFLPLYRSAGKATVAVEVVSVLACTAGLLGGIFRPKCYLVLLKPERILHPV
ncbi:LOW QUALITY PROTEIN: vomeronasal type-2 receptor 26-like [Erethizon dorsatum]